jgi:DNA (cytosine-5)-methyltransferase 1
VLTLMDWFCGAGGSSQGAHSVPGVEVTRAANHWAKAIESHATNFPNVDHWRGDIREAPVHRWPVTDIFWASPECPQWSVARGKRRDFANTLQDSLFGEVRDEEVERSRALMEEVPIYLRGVQDRGGLVLAGVVENVVDVRAWDQWDRWLGEIRKLGYKTRTIAINSMHAHSTRTPTAPQSRDRLYVAYWHQTLGRTPNWDKWLRPTAWCSGCDEWVSAMQVFKQPGADMGRYRTQYVYRCPNSACRSQVVEPRALPAAAAIDWSLPGQRIGDRAKPLADKTLARIRAGLEKYARPITAKAMAVPPLMVPAGGTWRNDATPITEPMPTRTTRENDAIAIPPFLVPLRSGRNRSLRADTDPLATIVADGGNHGLVVPPLLVPVEGREGKEAASAASPLRTQTARNETGLAWLPFIAELRGGGSDARSVAEALATVTASGNHHGLVAPTAGIDWETLLVPYYGNGHARPAAEPIGTLSTRDRYAVVNGLADIDLDDVLFRMLEPHEIGRAMAFGQGYTVLGNKREKVRQYGNAVTPPVAEIIVSALVEAITGADLERAA